MTDQTSGLGEHFTVHIFLVLADGSRNPIKKKWVLIDMKPGQINVWSKNHKILNRIFYIYDIQKILRYTYVNIQTNLKLLVCPELDMKATTIE